MARAYAPFDGLRLAGKYKGSWKEINQFLGNRKWPEGKTPKEKKQFRREATKYFVSDGIFYCRLETNEPPAKMLVSTEQNGKQWKLHPN
jgi:hypothetical protein